MQPNRSSSDSGIDRRAWVARALAMLGSASLSRVALGQDWSPSKPLQLVVPYPPGGSNDNVGRLLARQMTRLWGQPVVVENRPGAAGIIGAGTVARAPADGHTLALVSSSFVMSAAVQPKLPFDPIKDFAAVARLQSTPFLVLVSPATPVRDLPGLVALAKRQPGKLSYGTSGIGSSNQFATELFASMTGVHLTHVPYKGMSPALADLAGGHLDIVLASVPSAQALVAAGKVRPLAITSRQRAREFTAIPTVAESGIPGYEFEAWAGILAPGGTPRAIIKQLNAGINQALGSDEAAQARATEAADFTPLSAEAFQALVIAELQRWRKIAQALGIKPE